MAENLKPEESNSRSTARGYDGGGPPPMAAAMQWVHRITTVVLEMVLPGLGGVWLDKKFGTNYIALLGFALGLITAITHLLQMTKQVERNQELTPEDYSGRNTEERSAD